MKKQQKIKGTILVSGILLCICLLFFSDSTDEELTITPDWVLNLKTAQGMTVAANPREPLVPFRVHDIFGYVDLKGNLSFKGIVQYDVTQSARGFINYSSVQTEEQSLVYFNPGGEFINSYQLTGYPLLSRDGNRLFILHTAGLGLREIDESGNTIWEVEFARQMTTLAFSHELVCLGFINGLLQLYDRSGNCIYEFLPTGSRIPVILGCALNRAGTRLAVVAGLDPQFLISIEGWESKTVIPYYYPLGTDFRKEVFLEFSADSKYLFCGSGEFCCCYNTKKQQGYVIDLKGQFHSLSIAEDSRLFCVVSSQQKLKSIRIFRPGNFLIFHDVFEAEYVFEKLIGDQLLLGLDDYLLKFDIREM